MTPEEKELNIDGLTFMYMMEGLPYEEAQQEALVEFEEMKSEDNTPPPGTHP